MGVPLPAFTVGGSSSSSGPAPTQVPLLTKNAELLVLETPVQYTDRLIGLSETGLYIKKQKCQGSYWSSVLKVLNNVLFKQGSGRPLTDEEQEIYETEPSIRDFDLTIQYLNNSEPLES